MRYLLLSALLGAAIPAASPTDPPSQPARDSAFHLLNRLAYGPTPGQIDAVAREGVLHWIDRQLALGPRSDRNLRDRERSFPLLDTSTEDLGRMFLAARRERKAARRDSIRTHGEGGPMRALASQLPRLAVLRADLAEHQLLEVMADFWTNHFNVFYGKALDRVFLPDYIESTIRPHALGRFADLLLATAKSPAMLVYLDQAQSIAPGSEPPGLRRLRGPGPRRWFSRRPEADSMVSRIRNRMPTGINENYARELLELHTLGVDGGYTQQDVIGVARILTGWSFDRGIRRGGTPGGFIFNDWAHDRGAKQVLGIDFPAGHGRDEGERLLRALADHPATMHHVSAKLCARLVADESPDSCIDLAVATWRRTHGDIAAIVRAIALSPDFWSPRNVAAKVKTPLEFVVSALRAVGADPDTGGAAVAAIARLGQPLFLQSVPTGYPETQEDWVNSAALLARMNFAVALAGSRVPGVRIDLDRIAPSSADPDQWLEALDRQILGGRMTGQTRSVIRAQVATVADPAAARALGLGLALGSPEFQRQ